jgi:hypothetical protein
VLETKIATVPTIQFRRVQFDYDGRGDTGKRLKDAYVHALPNGKLLVTNFSGAMVVVEGGSITFPVSEA